MIEELSAQVRQLRYRCEIEHITKDQQNAFMDLVWHYLQTQQSNCSGTDHCERDCDCVKGTAVDEHQIESVKVGQPCPVVSAVSDSLVLQFFKLCSVISLVMYSKYTYTSKLFESVSLSLYQSVCFLSVSLRHFLSLSASILSICFSKSLSVCLCRSVSASVCVCVRARARCTCMCMRVEQALWTRFCALEIL